MTLISNWRDCWRFWSVRLQVAGVFLLGFLEAFPDAAISIWAATPADIRSQIPADAIQWFGYAIIVAGIIARVIRQNSLHDPVGERSEPNVSGQGGVVREQLGDPGRLSDGGDGV